MERSSSTVAHLPCTGRICSRRHWRSIARKDSCAGANPPEGYAVQVEQLAFANADAAGVVSGEYRTLADGPGAVDGTAQFSRLDATQLHRYVPLAAGAGVREWVRTSLLAGGSSDARIKVSGNLADFPFADGKKGQFTMTAKAQGVTLDYATHWPRLTGLDGEFRVDGARISVDGRNARAFNAAIGRIKIEIADMRIAHPALRIEGEAVGPAADFLRFIAESPVDEWLDHTTRGAVASGDGKLALKLELPIGNHDGDQIAGEFTFSGNRLKFGGGIPALNQLNGKLAFTRREIHSTGLTAEILGGPGTTDGIGRRWRHACRRAGQRRRRFAAWPISAAGPGCASYRHDRLAACAQCRAGPIKLDARHHAERRRPSICRCRLPSRRARRCRFASSVARREAASDLLQFTYGRLGG